MKAIEDVLNWFKSELANETNEKLSKTMNPYRSEKIIFLRKAIKKLEIGIEAHKRAVHTMKLKDVNESDLRI